MGGKRENIGAAQVEGRRLKKCMDSCGLEKRLVAVMVEVRKTKGRGGGRNGREDEGRGREERRRMGAGMGL